MTTQPDPDPRASLLRAAAAIIESGGLMCVARMHGNKGTTCAGLGIRDPVNMCQPCGAAIVLPGLARALTEAEAENARRRMLAEMAAADAVFFADSSPFITGGDGHARAYVMCSDEFAFACADAEQIPDDEIADVYAAWKADGNIGALAWVCIKRNALPFARHGHEKDALHLAKAEAAVARLRAAGGGRPA